MDLFIQKLWIVHKQIRVLIAITRTLPQALRASSLPDGAYRILILKCQVLVEKMYYKQLVISTDKQKFPDINSL